MRKSGVQVPYLFIEKLPSQLTPELKYRCTGTCNFVSSVSYMQKVVLVLAHRDNIGIERVN